MRRRGRKRPAALARLAALAMTVLCLAACDDSSMRVQNRYEVYGKAPLFPGGAETQTPPPGTVAQGDAAYAADLATPPHLDAALLARGADHARVNDKGQTALAAAVFKQAEDAVRLADLTERTTTAERRVDELEVHVEGLQRRIHDLEASTSWRVTAPLRWASERARRG